MSERRKRAQDALGYNALAWPEISRLGAGTLRGDDEQPGVLALTHSHIAAKLAL
ncbi:MAG: hypothetical protein M3436_17290 [Pseudomonadota bacterium]|nr:hypothetical protein [Pseudomonadota bacterium]